jgi:hypothetical protein
MILILANVLNIEDRTFVLRFLRTTTVTDRRRFTQLTHNTMLHAHRLVILRTLCLVVTLLHVAESSAQLPVIQLSSLSQSSGQTGTEFDLTVVGGSQLDEIERLQFSVPGITSTLHTDEPLPFTTDRLKRFGAFHVAIPADTKPGLYDVRAIGRFGISNPRAFVVAPLRVTKLDSVSHDLAAPTPIERSVIYHAKATPEAIDYFSMKLEAGESVRVDLLAQQIDSRLIGKLMIREPSGQWTHLARGAQEVDSSLNFNAALAGDYVLAVHDFIHSGGDEFFYNLVVQSGDTAISFARDFRLRGQPESFTLKERASDSSTALPESPDTIAVSIPCELAGTFDSPTDLDTFRFDAVEGEAIAIELASHRLGESTDGRISIERLEKQADGTETWQPVRSEDDSQDVGDGAIKLFTRDPSFLFQVPMTTSYRLSLRDLDTGEAFGPVQSYHLSLRRAQPDFSLLAYFPSPIRDLAQSSPQGVNLVRGGTLSVTVMAIRHDGLAIPIRLYAEGLPDSVKCSEIVMAANQQLATLTLVAKDDAGPWDGSIRIIGKSRVDATNATSPELTHEAIAACVTWGRGAGRERVRTRLCDSLGISVSANDSLPIAFAPMPAERFKGKKESTITIPISVTRREGGNQAIVLRPQSLPPGVTLGEVTIPAEQSEAKLELTVTAGALPGVYCFWLQAETKVKLPLNPAALQRAEAYRAHLAQLLADPAKAADHPAKAADHPAITAAITVADQRVEAARASAQPQDRNVFIATPTIAIEIESL